MTVTIDGTSGITYPAGTIQGTGYGPAFSAYLGANTSITTNTWTKIPMATELFDTANCYDNSTNYRFTPNVAGYYQINAEARVNGTSVTIVGVRIDKNGGVLGAGIIYMPSGVSAAQNVCCGHVIYMNGSTDYVEAYGYGFGSSLTFDYAASGSGAYACRFSGTLLRG